MNMKIALVTGANRGIGFEICRQLARLPAMQVILSCRDVAKGQAAVEKLTAEGLQVDFVALDVAEESSRVNAFNHIMQKYGRLDVLVNNAGVFLDSRESSSVLTDSLESIRAAMEINTYAPLRLCQLFVPSMIKNGYGRIVNVSSGMGQLSEMNGGCASYRLSKTAVNAVTCSIADELKGTDVLINSVCPGWVKTDMGGAGASRELPEGADGIVWLATLPTGSVSGKFFRDRQVIEW